MSDLAIPEFAIARLELKPGDILVARCRERLPRHVHERVAAMLRPQLPARVKCLVIDGGLELAVLSAAELQDLAERAA